MLAALSTPLPRFSHLYCDLLFVVASKCPWENANDLRRDDPIVDSEEAWDDHYRWCPLVRRTRFTLKPDPGRSFQPQASDGSFIGIVPLLRKHGTGLPKLRAGMHAGTGSQPMTIPAATAQAITETLRSARNPHRTRTPHDTTESPRPGITATSGGHARIPNHRAGQAPRSLRILAPGPIGRRGSLPVEDWACRHHGA